MKRAEILGFVSTKGGVGKTTVVSNLGYLLSNKHNKSVLVVDGNFTAPSLGSHFGIISPGMGIADAMVGKIDVKSTVHKVEGKLDFLPVGFVSKNLDYKAMRSYLCSMRSKYDYILIDSSPTMNQETLAAIYASDKVFMISTPDHVSLNNSMQTLNLAKEAQTYLSGVILNRSKSKIYELSAPDIEQALGVPVVGSVDETEKVTKSLAHFKTLVNKYPSSNSSIEFNKLGAAICGAPYRAEGFVPKLKSLFSKKIKQADINRTLLMESHY